jgi:hypothetical protein
VCGEALTESREAGEVETEEIKFVDLFGEVMAKIGAEAVVTLAPGRGGVIEVGGDKVAIKAAICGGTEAELKEPGGDINRCGSYSGATMRGKLRP